MSSAHGQAEHFEEQPSELTKRVDADLDASAEASVDGPATEHVSDDGIVVKSAPAASPASEPVARPAPSNLPRVALMGEFSAGKSTLSNLLLGKSALPVNVTATQLPPVWMSYGDAAPYAVTPEGEEFDVDPSFSDVTVEGTSHVRLFHDSKFLEMCDLIDMPGISDPNMAAEVWQRVIHEADIVIWCSHATQAWRQSEAAVWSTMPPELYKKSLLLLTRMDRILSDRDRQRVVKRVEKETEGLFRKVVPASLLMALEAGEDADAFAASGAEFLVRCILKLVDEVAGEGEERTIMRKPLEVAASSVDSAITEEERPKPKRLVMPTRVRPRAVSRNDLSG